VINSAADFGEGWFLPGEICELAESGVKKVVSLQPFGCIANHIISKGIERRYKDLYPDLSLLFLDFDAGTSEANVANRLHFMLEN
jgi:predicted nucleotide-binding protein (sugar kinase/HSP70/actin superfamily)